jgi:hypothetical protein
MPKEMIPTGFQNGLVVTKVNQMSAHCESPGFLGRVRSYQHNKIKDDYERKEEPHF